MARAGRQCSPRERDELRTPGARGTLLMVFTPAGAEERRRGKWVIEIDARVHERRGGQRRRPYQTNPILTAGYVQPEHLRDPRYVVLDKGGE